MNLTEEKIFEVVKANTMRVLVDARPEQISMDTALTDLGANSVDRVEVVMYSLEDLNIKVPMTELHGISNLRGLVELIARHSQGRSGA
jgi:polyketide biosynthesis acyl carrier protein